MKRTELYLRSLWLLVRRAPSDRGALVAVVYIVGGLLYVAAYLTLLVLGYREDGPWGFVLAFALLTLALGVAALIKRNNELASKSLLRLSSVTEEVSADVKDHRAKIATTLMRIAAMVDRAGCEALYQSGSMDEKYVGACRQRTLAIAESAGLWSELTEDEKSLLLTPEGSWASATVGTILARSEDVSVLRWVIGVDKILTPFEFWELDPRPAVQIMAKPSLVEGTKCLASWDLRPARDLAQMMLNRCVAEGVKRGVLTLPEEASQEWYTELADHFEGSKNDDLMIASKTIREASIKLILNVSQAASRRIDVLNGLIEYLGGASAAELRFQ